MQTIVLAGGLGTRLSEETGLKPKPMVEIGDRPMLHHILELYDAHGIHDFVLALGYLGHVIKRYVVDRATLAGDLEVDLQAGRVTQHGAAHFDWRIALVETGDRTETGGRVKRCAPRLKGGTFMLTYGDGLSDVDLTALSAFHKGHGRLATVTAVRPPARFGELGLEDGRVVDFAEKLQVREGWINGGFMCLEPGVLDYIAGDHTVLERDVLPRLAQEGQLMAFQHEGFWQCMDTLRDVRTLGAMWEGGSPPWRRRP